MTEIAVKEVRSMHDMPKDINLFNPEENIKYGVLLFEHYLRTCGSIKKAIICYNSGYAGLIRYRNGGMDALPEETKAYVPKVLGLMRSLDPMFQRELPDRREPTYLESAVNNVFDELYSGECAIFGPVSYM